MCTSVCPIPLFENKGVDCIIKILQFIENRKNALCFWKMNRIPPPGILLTEAAKKRSRKAGFDSGKATQHMKEAQRRPPDDDRDKRLPAGREKRFFR